MCDFTTFISSFVEAIKPNYKGFEPHTSPLFLTADTVHDEAVVGLNKSEQKQTERNGEKKKKYSNCSIHSQLSGSSHRAPRSKYRSSMD